MRQLTLSGCWSSEANDDNHKLTRRIKKPQLLVEPVALKTTPTTTAENLKTDQRELQPESDHRHRRHHNVIAEHSSSNCHRQQLTTISPPQVNYINQRDSEKETDKRRQQNRKMRNSKLTSMLVILFGLALLAATGSVSSQLNRTTTTATSSSSSAATTTTSTTTAAAAVLSTETSNKTSEPVAANLGTDGDGEESSALLEEDSPEEPAAALEDNDDTRLRSLIADTASEAVEKILTERSRGSDLATNDNSSDEAAEEDAGVDAAATTIQPTTVNNSTASSNQERDQEQLRRAFVVYKRWRATGDDIIELFSKKVFPLIMEHSYDLDPVSMASFLQIYNAIQGHKAWPLKLLDSWAKLSPGLLVGTQSDFGDFEECLNVRADNPSNLNEDEVGQGAGEVDPLTGLKPTTVVGRYCVADVEFPKPPRTRLDKRNEELQTDFAPIELRRPLVNFSETAEFKDTIFVETANFFHMLYVDPIRVGICITNKIDPDGFANVLNKLVKEFAVTISFKGRCVTKYDRPTWSTQQVVSAYILLAACSLVLLSTLLDLLHIKLNKLPLPKRFDAWKLNFRSSMLRYQPLFTSFSIIRNTKRLLKQQQPTYQQHQQQQQQYLNNNNNHNSVITAELAKSMALCSTSTSTVAAAAAGASDSSSSLESSPSIERRSGSVASSAMNLLVNSQQHQQSPSNKATFSPSFIQMHSTHPTRGKLGRGENNLNCLHGIRVITMTWMIVNHTYLFGGFFVLWAHRRLIDIAEWPKSISFQLVLNGWLTVETYFFLSAAIIVLNVMPLMQSKKFAYFSYIVHRLIRLLPAYVGLVCLNFLWPLVSSGPVWLVKGRNFIQTPCENYLWTNFLFINNWIWPEKQCMVHTWFLSADFQLYLVAPIIVYLLYRRPVFGHSLNIVVAILASILSGFVIYANKLMPATLINKLEFDSIKQQLSYSYFATYQHMGPYCLGIFVGYVLHKRPQMQLPKHLTWCLWLLLPPLSFTTLLLTYLWNGAYDEPALINPSPIVSALYVAIHRTIWTSLLAWIVFACATGRAKLMSSFLSSPVFVPLSRLSFSIYLVHLPVIMFRALNLRHTIEWTDSNILWEACGNFVVSLVFGYFLNIFFESPIINLERVVFGRGGSVASSTAASPIMSHHHKHNTDIGSFTPKSSDSDSSSSTGASSGEQSPPLVCKDRKLPPKWTSGEYDLYDSSNKKSATQPGGSADQHQQQVLTDRLSSMSANLEHQMESLATTKTSLIESSADNVAPPDSDRQRSISRQRFASAQTLQEDPLNMDSILSNESDLYPPSAGILPTSRFQRHPDRPYSLLSQQQQQQQLLQRYNNLQPRSSARPMQYATLARTSRPSQDDWALPASINGGDDDYDDDYLYHFGGAHKSRSHLGAPTSRPHSMTSELSRQRLAYSSQRQRHHQRPPTRYNTLTASGSSGSWQGGARYQIPAYNRASGGTTATDSWLQPGALLPRIDSSTLRRQSKLAAQEPTSSIAEESPPNSLDERN